MTDATGSAASNGEINGPCLEAALRQSRQQSPIANTVIHNGYRRS
ncbi:DUF2388 domain-containing protein [Pseudomonas nicosulfuronedens]|uniref:DUF2388 domain-containing protein n=1 Tax=Pseudomonas nicosulfuronedens TaxID=2571105 RepID=A0A5R9R2E4_9PSED|nr:DUF2388 domain-containing protein [Pseudomonas nicosulfuronedens]